MITYYISHHETKGMPIDKALRKAGWRFAYKKVQYALFDHYINRGKPEEGRGVITRFYNEGATVIQYPHGATGAWWMDGDFYPKNPMVSANLVISEGQKHVASIIDPDMKHHVIGWYYCPVKPFQQPKKVKRILFAPIHPPLKGELREEACIANTKIYKDLLGLTDKYQIIVRHINPLDKNCLWYSPKPVIKLGKPNESYDDIDLADIVIAEGTFMYLAVARGKPTIGINQHMPIRPNGKGHPYKPEKWEQYGEYMAYPIDYYDDGIINLIDKAVSEEQSEWKAKFIGNEMKDYQLLKTLESIRGQNA